MPVRRLSDLKPDRHGDLREALLAEWRHEAGGAGAPLIVLDEPEGLSAPIRLYVVWQRWEGIPPRDRSRVILDIYRQVTDEPNKPARVTIAMGLTPGEATRMGFDFETT